MIKIREAFEKWWGHEEIPRSVELAFEAGYQAAIAAVKEGIVVTTDENGWPVCVTLQDADCQIIEVLWES